MFRPRVIPVLLLRNKGLVKSLRFQDYRYIGDPINAVKIFNDLKADELVFLDINASREKRKIPLTFVKNVGEEANMPFSVGGGINTLEDIRNILECGAEKVIINTAAVTNRDFIREAASTFGSSTISVCIDVKKNIFGKEKVWIKNGSRSTNFTPIEFAKQLEHEGAGEIIVQSIQLDGTMKGYDINLIKNVSEAVSIPVIALGGAGTYVDLKQIYCEGNASAMGVGSMFIFQGKRRSVLINYPSRKELIEIFT